MPTLFPSLEHLGLDHCRVPGALDGAADDGASVMASWAQQAYASWHEFPPCSESDYVRDGTYYIIGGTIPDSWGAWSTSLRTLWVWSWGDAVALSMHACVKSHSCTTCMRQWHDHVCALDPSRPVQRSLAHCGWTAHGARRCPSD